LLAAAVFSEKMMMIVLVFLFVVRSISIINTDEHYYVYIERRLFYINDPLLFCPVFRHLFFTQKKFTRSENDDQMASVK
jgi:hypothetical protein